MAAQAPTPCIAQWQPTFGSSDELDGLVRCVASLDLGAGPRLFAGGDFNSASGVFARSVAMFNGARWEELSGTISGKVLSLAVFDSGSGPELYAAGTVPGGVMRWNGLDWSIPGGGLSTSNPEILPVGHALVVHDDGSGPALYVGGAFQRAGGLDTNNLARWNGSSWSVVSGGVTSSIGWVNATVRALTSADLGGGAALYVGGDFTTAGSISASRVACWSGGAWTTLSSGCTGPVNALHAFDAGAGTRLYAGGDFANAGGVSVSHVASWNGSSWSALGSGLGAPANALASMDTGSGRQLFVAGKFTTAGGGAALRLARWDGLGWSPVGAGVNGELLSLATHDFGAGTRLCVAGSIGQAGGLAVSYVAHTDGVANWSGLSRELNQPARAFAAYDDGSGLALHAGGTFTTGGGVALSRVGKWTGSQWQPLGSGMNAAVNDLLALDLGAGSELYATGTFTAAGGAAAARVARWNGSVWQPLGLGLDGAGQALAAHDDGSGLALFVGGSFVNAGGQPANGVARWNGSAWSSVGALSAGVRVKALVVFDDGAGPKLFAGGIFPSPGGGFTAVARWDGATWSTIGATDLGVEAQALAVFDSGSGPQLYAGGNFGVNGPPPFETGIARWTGSAWADVGGQSFQLVSDLAVFDAGTGPRLYAAYTNSFPSLGATALASWDGVQWQGVGGFSAMRSIESLDLGAGSTLYASGDFLTSPAGDARVAVLACPGTPTTFCRPSAPGSFNFCIATIAASGQPSVSGAGSCVLTVSGVDGQRNGLFLYGVSGQISVPWCAGSSSQLCVAPPRQRMQLLFSGGSSGLCDGVLQQDWNAWQAARPTALGQPWSSGASVDVQAWFRDPLSCRGSGLSEGIRLTYQ